VLCVFWGFIIYSLYINIFLDLLLYNKGESNSVALLDRIETYSELKEMSGFIIGRCIKLYRMRKNKDCDESEVK